MFTTIICVLGLVGYAWAQGCADCYRKHPQQVYCDAVFIAHIQVNSMEQNIRMPGYSESFHKKVSATIITDLKPQGEEKVPGTIVEFFSPSSFCGTWFDDDKEYVVVGQFVESDVNGQPYLLHGNCDYAKEWSALSVKQKHGFEVKYRSWCNCEIIPVKSAISTKVSDMHGGADYDGARSYWTPYRRCYYNPFQSAHYGRDDCEDLYGYCKLDSTTNECNWKLTNVYEVCFEERERYILALEAAGAITDIKQCDVLTNRRKRRKCRKNYRDAHGQGDEVVVPPTAG